MTMIDPYIINDCRDSWISAVVVDKSDGSLCIKTGKYRGDSMIARTLGTVLNEYLGRKMRIDTLDNSVIVEGSGIQKALNFFLLEKDELLKPFSISQECYNAAQRVLCATADARFDARRIAC